MENKSLDVENKVVPTEKKPFFQKVKNVLKYILEEYIKFPAYIIVHPVKGYEMFKREKRAKMSVSIVFIIVTIIVSVIAYQYEGFLVNDRDLNELNSFAQMAYVVVPILLVTFANWSITTLFDGKGKVKEIFMMICYSLYPLIWSQIIGIILSNTLVQDEVGFYSVIMVLGTVFMGYMVFMGLINIHEYGLGKCIITIIATLIALCVILFALFLLFDLFQRVYGFLYVIYREITLRNLIW